MAEHRPVIVDPTVHEKIAAANNASENAFAFVWGASAAMFVFALLAFIVKMLVA